MGSPGFDEISDEFELDPDLDDQLRAEFEQTFPTRSASPEVFDELIPAFGRARRIRRTKQTLVTVAGAALLLGGVGFGASQLADRDNQGLTFAGESEPELPEEQPDPLEVTGTTDQSDQTSAPTSTSTTGTMSSAAVSSSTQGPTTTAATTSQTSAASQTTATAPGSTSTTLIESDCGGVGVSYSDREVVLLESLPASGYSADEKSTGPESIEVSFEGPGGHCEVKAEVTGGRLEVDID